jgi:hypothetical protein
VRTPEEALAEARARSAAAGPGDDGPEQVGAREDPRHVSLRRLTEWAVIEPEEADVYSTRRWGAPITAIKRLLIRLMRQYLFQISGQQTRFNVYALGELMALQERVRALEQAAAGPSGAAAEPSEAPAEPSEAPAEASEAGSSPESEHPGQ